MKKIAIPLLGLLAWSQTLAQSASFSGFAALDLMTYNKFQDQVGTYDMGIGVLDMKARARYKDFTTKIKFDLDSKSIKYDQTNLVEEFSLTWQPNYDWRITAGKYKAIFHQLHWGATEHCYTDGGSILNIENTYRDLDRRPVVTVRYGSYRAGLMNYFSVFGNPTVLKEGDNGTYTEVTNYKIDLMQERGFTNRFEFFPTNEWSFGVAGLYYKYDLNPAANFAFDASSRYKSGPLEVWFEYVWGRGGSNPLIRYAKYKTDEQMIQLGAEYEYNDLVNFIVNAEAAIVNYIGYDYNKTTKTYSVSDKTKQQDNIKLDSAVKFKLADSTQITAGPLLEKKYYRDGNGNLKTTWGYQLSAGLSMWF